jgi:hypothetical protein
MLFAKPVQITLWEIIKGPKCLSSRYVLDKFQLQSASVTCIIVFLLRRSLVVLIARIRLVLVSNSAILIEDDNL